MHAEQLLTRSGDWDHLEHPVHGLFRVLSVQTLSGADAASCDLSFLHSKLALSLLFDDVFYAHERKLLPRTFEGALREES